MAKSIRARFSNGKIEPLERVEFPEGQELVVTISELPPATGLTEGMRAAAGGWRDIVDTEALLRDIYRDRSVSRPPPPDL